MKAPAKPPRGVPRIEVTPARDTIVQLQEERSSATSSAKTSLLAVPKAKIPTARSSPGPRRLLLHDEEEDEPIYVPIHYMRRSQKNMKTIRTPLGGFVNVKFYPHDEHRVVPITPARPSRFRRFINFLRTKKFFPSFISIAALMFVCFFFAFTADKANVTAKADQVMMKTDSVHQPFEGHADLPGAYSAKKYKVFPKNHESTTAIV